MKDLTYKKALKEVYVVLNSSNREVIDKLPEELIQYIMNNMDNKHEFQIDLNKALIEQNLMERAKIILAQIYKNYLCDGEEKINLKKLKELENFQKRLKYNPDNIFNKNKW